ncbi:tryptophanase leader peptide [Photobacterium ganghwense]|nr:tryptophanase leader peptide [Photobacterium ganghwense]PSU07608.1 tryptophanase leader peptide [Photobacterium ganghwense]QSV17469.1 tryptophanase leader peptide [Photobacterium ganghwense]
MDTLMILSDWFTLDHKIAFFFPAK